MVGSGGFVMEMERKQCSLIGLVRLVFFFIHVLIVSGAVCWSVVELVAKYPLPSFKLACSRVAVEYAT